VVRPSAEAESGRELGCPPPSTSGNLEHVHPKQFRDPGLYPIVFGAIRGPSVATRIEVGVVDDRHTAGLVADELRSVVATHMPRAVISRNSRFRR